jgi:carbonic anhydrase
MKKKASNESVDRLAVDRRRFLGVALGACAINPLGPSSTQLAASMSGSLTKEQRDSMTPSQVVDELKKGNERFRAGKMAPRDYLAEKRSSAGGQYPVAVILGCVDSRVPAEIVFDTGIGDTFNGRAAGNLVNDDLLGSMEFACALRGKAGLSPGTHSLWSSEGYWAI